MFELLRNYCYVKYNDNMCVSVIIYVVAICGIMKLPLIAEALRKV